MKVGVWVGVGVGVEDKQLELVSVFPVGQLRQSVESPPEQVRHEPSQAGQELSDDLQ